MKRLCERVKDHNVGEKEESEWMTGKVIKKTIRLGLKVKSHTAVRILFCSFSFCNFRLIQ